MVSENTPSSPLYHPLHREFHSTEQSGSLQKGLSILPLNLKFFLLYKVCFQVRRYWKWLWCGLPTCSSILYPLASISQNMQTLRIWGVCFGAEIAHITFEDSNQSRLVSVVVWAKRDWKLGLKIAFIFQEDYFYGLWVAKSLNARYCSLSFNQLLQGCLKGVSIMNC